MQTRLLNQVDERRNPRTRATINQLLDRYLELLDVEDTTRSTYVALIDKHIRPVIGSVMVARLDAELLDSFYARLRTCRAHSSNFCASSCVNARAPRAFASAMISRSPSSSVIRFINIYCSARSAIGLLQK